MKKKIATLLIATLAFGVVGLTGCGANDGATNEATENAATENAATEETAQETEGADTAEDSTEETTDAATGELEVLKVGASITPHAEILAQVKDTLAAEGYDLQVVEYNDYVLPNTALEDGELDANFFQHQPYLDDFNAENGTHLVSVAAVHFEPFGLYAGKTDSIANLKDGAVVAVPNDTTNEARALLLLEAQGLIKLKEGAGLTATVLDIEENPLNLEIKEIEAAQLVRSLPDVDIAAINGNYAAEGGLNVADAIAVEASDSLAADTYANVIVVKEGNENSEKTQALVNAVLSDGVKSYIEETYGNAVIPVF
ncbi:MAG: MetQ/NlpA family ABC transporter substrate-binding protein [Lachnospiraceae bacterium]|nr:MetQ/NlpA family ABC transporter substrate-binding protein [Lachnospiraceae bacterium]